MKMPLVKRLVLKSLSLSVPAFILPALSTAASTREFVSGEASSALHVKFSGGDNEILFFDAKYDNKAGHTFRLSVLDETGEVCLQDNYSTRDFKKKIKNPRLTDTDYVIFLSDQPKRTFSLAIKLTSPRKWQMKRFS